VQPLRVHQPTDVPDHPALARGVHPLQHDEHGPPSAADRLGVQRLLQVVETCTEIGNALHGSGLVLRADRAGARIHRRKVESGGYPEGLTHRCAHGPSVVAA
jgi:hypothetical protein